jgi:RimJ/RimL family protein N-acetyltransferase
MTLLGRTIGLRALTPADYGPLYDLCNSTEVTTWRNLARNVPPDAFPGFLWEGVHSQRAVFLRREPSRCVGLVSLFNEDAANQVAYLSVVVDPTAPTATAGGEAVALWLRHVFASTSLRKVYAETTDLSLSRAQSALRVPGAREEGRLRSHLLRGGQAHDLVVIAFSRDTLLAEGRDVLAFVDRSADQAAAAPVPVGSFAEFTRALSAAFPDLVARATIASLPGGCRLTDDLGLDSIAILEIVSWAETLHRVALPDEALVDLATLQDLYGALEAAS